MNVWIVVLNVVGYIVLFLLILFAVAIVWSFVKTTISKIKKKRSLKKGLPPIPSDETVRVNGATHARELYRAHIFKDMETVAFQQGLEYGLAAKRGDLSADRV